MDQNLLIGILAQTHIQCTINNPITYNKVTGNLLNVQKIFLLRENNEIFNDVFDEFNKKKNTIWYYSSQ